MLWKGSNSKAGGMHGLYCIGLFRDIVPWRPLRHIVVLYPYNPQSPIAKRCHTQRQSPIAPPFTNSNIRYRLVAYTSARLRPVLTHDWPYFR
jgi:hypothetical protein